MFYLARNGKDSESKKDPGKALTILVIILSFGALVLSGFMPVHIFDLAVVTGLTTAFIFAMLIRGRVF
jgi:predicted exporter